jgi:hypothetical protein
MIKIGLKGLAKFIASSPAAQRKVLRDYKYPKREGEAQARYYHEARLFIRRNHSRGNPQGWLSARSQELSLKAQALSGASAVRVRHNARALREYDQFLGNKTFEILSDLSLSLSYSGVTISVYPDLHVREAGVERVIKLEFGSKPPSEVAIRIISQAMFDAVSAAGLSLRAADILLIDVPRKTLYRGARMRSRTARDIEAACQTIADIWPAL